MSFLRYSESYPKYDSFTQKLLQISLESNCHIILWFPACAIELVVHQVLAQGFITLNNSAHSARLNCCYKILGPPWVWLSPSLVLPVRWDLHYQPRALLFYIHFRLSHWMSMPVVCYEIVFQHPRLWNISTCAPINAPTASCMAEYAHSLTVVWAPIQPSARICNKGYSCLLVIHSVILFGTTTLAP